MDERDCEVGVGDRKVVGGVLQGFTFEMMRVVVNEVYTNIY